MLAPPLPDDCPGKIDAYVKSYEQSTNYHNILFDYS